MDALDVIEYFMKIKISTDSILLSGGMIRLIGGYSDSIFNYLIQLDSDKIDYIEKYGEEAQSKFKETYSKDKSSTFKQI
ncbi:hypothetical protein BVAVS116_O0006 (plasmid) [Borreliella valaisiana VS116]|uniref:Uncharacterized protein n=1 Tax=Borreliella valaisiana VS116 TaxID=445987 RepID=C0R8B7_BORVA|nr:hypothetical protein BVAVS116_O0006 [Borreliella valaisiana VS116]